MISDASFLASGSLFNFSKAMALRYRALSSSHTFFRLGFLVTHSNTIQMEVANFQQGYDIKIIIIIIIIKTSFTSRRLQDTFLTLRASSALANAAAKSLLLSCAALRFLYKSATRFDLTGLGPRPGIGGKMLETTLKL